MSNNKMLIDATHPEETRVVVLRGGRVEEFDYESAARKLLRGNIYLAKVTRVEPSLQAAFVDYGGNRHGFLAFNEIHPDYYQIPMADRQALLDEEAAAEAEEEAAADARAEALARRRAQRDQQRQRREGGEDRDDDGADDGDDDDAAEHVQTLAGDGEDQHSEDEDQSRRQRRGRRGRGGRDRRGGRGDWQRGERQSSGDRGERGGQGGQRRHAEADGDRLRAREGEASDQAGEDRGQWNDQAAHEAGHDQFHHDRSGHDHAHDDASDVAHAEPRAEALPTHAEGGQPTTTNDDDRASHDRGERGHDGDHDRQPAHRALAEAQGLADDVLRHEAPRHEDVQSGAVAQRTAGPAADEPAHKVSRDHHDHDHHDHGHHDHAHHDQTHDDHGHEGHGHEGHGHEHRGHDDERDVADVPRARGNVEDEGVQDVNGVTEADAVEQVGSEDAMEEMAVRPRRRARTYKIQEVIKRRQIILVQVVKEERGNKGAALTTYLSLAGRYTVLMPNTARGGGISRKITQPQDRKRLKAIAAALEVPEGMGLIIRTAGASRTQQEIKRDFEYLLRLWESVRELTLQSVAPSLVYEEGNLIKRSIRDLYNKDIEEIIVAGQTAHAEAHDLMRMLMPSQARCVVEYREPEPLFTRFQIERQLNAMFSPYVTLRSGGYLVINQTEALVAIDVNSGRSTREFSIEETALNTNLEAAEEIARQLKLRDLAGLIVIDFIDMEERRNNRRVENRLKDALRFDRARIQVGRISHFGLLEMSRQRLRTGVLEGSTSQCVHCQGTGIIRSTESVALAVLRGLEDAIMAGARTPLIATTTPTVALYILNNKRTFITDMEKRTGLPISVQGSDKMQGANFTVEKGAAPIQPRRTERTAVNMDWGFESDADSDVDSEVGLIDTDIDDDSSSGSREAARDRGGRDGGRSEEEGRGGNGEDGQRSRRRRRRRGRRGDRQEGGERVREAEPRAQASDGPFDDDEQDDAPQAGEQGQPLRDQPHHDEEPNGEFAADGDDEGGEDEGDVRASDNGQDGNGERRKRGRRRGRRGGRRGRERGSAETGAVGGVSGEPGADREASTAADGEQGDHQHRHDHELAADVNVGGAHVGAGEMAQAEPMQPVHEPRHHREHHHNEPAHREPGPAAAAAEASIAIAEVVEQTSVTVQEAAVSAPAPAAAEATPEPAPARRRTAESSAPRIERVVVRPDAPTAPATEEIAPEQAAQPRKGWWSRKLLG